MEATLCKTLDYGHWDPHLLQIYTRDSHESRFVVRKPQRIFSFFFFFLILYWPNLGERVMCTPTLCQITFSGFSLECCPSGIFLPCSGGPSRPAQTPMFCLLPGSALGIQLLVSRYGSADATQENTGSTSFPLGGPCLLSVSDL